MDDGTSAHGAGQPSDESDLWIDEGSRPPETAPPVVAPASSSGWQRVWRSSVSPSGFWSPPDRNQPRSGPRNKRNITSR